jgi:hypothetical protein
LAGSLGHAQSTRLVLDRIAQLGLPPTMDQAQALTLLDSLAGDPGKLGTLARFAKARFILAHAD